MYLNKILNFFRDKTGNVAIIFSLAIVPILFSVGVTVDYSKISRIKSRLQESADTAAFHAIKGHIDGEYDEGQIDELALKMVKSNYNIETSEVEIDLDVTTDKLSVHLETVYYPAFLKAFRYNEVVVTAFSEVSYDVGKKPVSMFLVLDRSGSMAWSNGDGGSKMQSLQIAVNDMTTNLKEADPERKYIRMGAVAYSSYMWSVQQIRWNLDRANDYVQEMDADGGTDSSDAVQKGFNKLKNSIELSEHINKNGQTPDLVMIFMTDGDNNNSGDDVTTTNTCNAAKDYGVEIYTVAFQAPEKGQQLLGDCATDSDHYFEPENTTQLIEAFNDIGVKVGEKLVLSR